MAFRASMNGRSRYAMWSSSPWWWVTLPCMCWAEDLPDVGEVALDQSQHVLEGGGVVHVPLPADSDVYRRRVREHAALPPVVVRHALVAGPAAPRRDPGVAVDPEALPDLQPPRPSGRLGRRHHPAVLHYLEGVDGEDALGPRLDLDRSRSRKLQGVADLLAVDRQVDDRPAAEECPPGGDGLAPVVVGEIDVAELRVRAVEADGDVARHLVRPADQREPVSAAQVPVVLAVVEGVLPDHLDGVQTARRHQRGGLPVGIGEVRVDDVAALGVGPVRPVAERGLHGAADLRLAQAVAAPRHHRLLQPPQDHVAHEVLAVLLGDVDDAVAGPRDAWLAGEVLGVREEAAPLGLEQVDDVQVLALRLRVGALGPQEVDVRVAAVPALPVHVGPALEAQSELALARLDVDPGAQRFVLEAPRHVDEDLASRGSQPRHLPSM